MKHISVLKSEILEQFKYLGKKPGIFVDGTLGLAGHSLAILEKSPKLTTVGIDQDLSAIDEAGKLISASKLSEKFILVHNNFKNIKSVLAELKIAKIDGALLDLGVSSMQLDEKERGFSFQDPNQPLDMRMDRENDLTAAKILNSYQESRLTEIFFKYGEEKFARKIARNIIEARKKDPIKKVGQLVEILEKSIPISVQKRSKTHFATKVFQALRIETNEELRGLDETISDFVSFLKPGARLAIISFHSLEDRIVKQTFDHLTHPCQCPPEMPCVCGLKPIVKILTKKPIVPFDEETKNNPRSRSAKLRVIEKI